MNPSNFWQNVDLIKKEMTVKLWDGEIMKL